MKKIKNNMKASVKNLLVVALIATLFLVNFSQIIAAENKAHDIYENVSDTLFSNDSNKETNQSGKYLFNNFTDKPKEIFDPFAILNEKDKLNSDNSSIFQRPDYKNNQLNLTYSKSSHFDRQNRSNDELSLIIQKLLYNNKFSDLLKITNKNLLKEMINNIYEKYPHPNLEEVYNLLTSYDKESSYTVSPGDNITAEDPVVCGYVTNISTGDPIEGADVNLYWFDNQGHYYYNDTFTDINGFYSMNVAAGKIHLNIYADGYYDQSTNIYFIDEFDTLWLNVSLYPRLEENAVVCGYVADNSTGYPIEGADVNLHWHDNQGHYYYNDTLTDADGFYSMNVAAGEIYLDIDCDGYFYESTDYYSIGAFDTLWLNVSLYPRLEENAVVCGYVIENSTGYPIEGADVYLYWDDNQGHSYYNYTLTDADGFYSMNVATGEISLNIYPVGYYIESTGYYSIGEFDTLWLNVSLYPLLEENAVVCGYLTDNSTGDPIKGADVDLLWNDNQGHYYYNDTFTDSDGFYSMNVAAGEIYLSIYADGYYHESTDYYSIGAFDTLWLNVSLYPRLEENAVVCGYVADNSTGYPIEGAYVYLYWYDDQGYSNSNYTLTDINGFYSMNVAAGEIYLDIDCDGYFYESTDYYSIWAFDTLWLNVSLYPVPEENAVVCGYVADNSTGYPIEGADVYLYWDDNQGHSYYNYTLTDADGFYSMNVAAGEIHLHIGANEYFYELTDYYSIGAFDTLWLNVSLYPVPEENAIVCGYVTDNSTGDPIEGAYIDLYWHDNQGHSNSNYTLTYINGFYSMNVAAGEIYLEASYEGDYTNEYSSWLTIVDNQTIWTNFTLEYDITDPTISDLNLPDYVWTNHSGDIGATVGDRNLKSVMMYLIDYTGYTFNQSTAIWIYTNFSGVNSTYLFKDYNGTFASLEQGNNSTPATILVLSNLTSDDKVCIFAEFKKNQTSSWGLIVMEYNISTGLLANIGIPQALPDGNIYLEYMNEFIEPGVSIVIPLMVNLYGDWIPVDPNTNFTLYSIEDSNNPTLGWHPLNIGVYYGFIQAIDKANNYNQSFFDLVVTNNPYYISGNIYYDGSQTEPMYVWLFFENQSVPFPISKIVLTDSYEFAVINGTYMVVAFMDINGNRYPDEYEPIGWCINKTISEMFDPIVINGSNMSDINITLFMAISGTVYYDGESSGLIYIMAFDEQPKLTEELVPIASTIISSPEAYTLYVPSDTNYIFGFMDVNYNMTPDINSEPMGFAINNTYLQGADPINLDGIGEDGINLTFWLIKASETNQMQIGENIFEPAGMNTTVVINTSCSSNISFVSYSNNPHPVNSPPFSLNKFIEITIENQSCVIWPANIKIYYTQTDLDALNITEDKLLGIYFWNDTANKWQLYNDTGVNTSYNQNGYEGYCWVNVWHLTPILPGGDNIPPSKVTGLTVTDAKNGKLNLAWNASTDNDFDHYKIYRDSVFIKNSTINSYQDTGLTNGHSYSYQVSAVDICGNEGEKSDSKSGKPTATKKPSNNQISYEEPQKENKTNLTNPPTADANGPYAALTFENIIFDGSGSRDNGTIANYTWSFGDGVRGYGVKPVHSYSTNGSFIVTLKVTDNDGLTGTNTTYANITLDSDGDGWSDVEEMEYGSNKTDHNSTPLNTDNDNDGLSDVIELQLGSDPKNTSDVKTIDIEGKAYYLVDTNGDGKVDKFYDPNTNKNTTLGFENGKYLIDKNGDGSWDYTYDPAAGITTYQKAAANKGIPGFELILVVCAISLVFFWKRKRKQR